jgi:hypothetical protein
LDGSGAKIDSGTSKSLEFTPNEIREIEAIACTNLQRASETEDVCTYSLLFNMAQYPIMSGSSIEIELPDDLHLDSVVAAQQESSTQNIADNSATFKVTDYGGKTKVKITGAFDITSNNNLPSWKLDSF